MGAHHGRHAASPPQRTPLPAWLVIGPIAVATLAGLSWLWPQDDAVPAHEQASATQYDGTITVLPREQCPEHLPDEVDGRGTAGARTFGAHGGRDVESTQARARPHRGMGGASPCRLRSSGGSWPRDRARVCRCAR